MPIERVIVGDRVRHDNTKLYPDVVGTVVYWPAGSKHVADGHTFWIKRDDGLSIYLSWEKEAGLWMCDTQSYSRVDDLPQPVETEVEFGMPRKKGWEPDTFDMDKVRDIKGFIRG